MAKLGRQRHSSNTARGQSIAAAAAWEKCIAFRPDNVSLREQAIAFFIGSSDREMNRRGRKMLEDALAINPQDWRLQIWQARVLLLDKTSPAVDKAIDILTKTIADHSTNVEGWTLLCQAWRQKNEPAKAFDVVLRGLVFLPENRTLLLLKAQIEATHSPLLAIPTVRRLYDKDPNDVDVAIYLAALYVNGNQYSAALSVLGGQATSVPNARRKIESSRAVVLHKSGEEDQARKLFESLEKDDPNDATVMLAKAGLLKEEEKWDDLAEYVSAWYQNHPDKDNAVVAVINEISGGQNAASRKAAEEILKRAIAVKASSPDLTNALAGLLYVSGRPQEAMSLYERLIDLDPENLTAINNLSWILCEDIGKYAQSLELAQKGLRIDPDILTLLIPEEWCIFVLVSSIRPLMIFLNVQNCIRAIYLRRRRHIFISAGHALLWLKKKMP